MFGRLKRALLWYARRIVRLARAIRYAGMHPPTYPTALQIEHTNRCNLRCVMCAQAAGTVPEVPDLSFDEVVRVLDDFRGPNAKPGFEQMTHLHLQGIGEPFLHKHTTEMLREAKDRGLNTSIVSNMTIFNETIARELIEMGHDILMVSVDAADANDFMDIRRGANRNTLGKIFKNLAMIQRVKQELGATKPALHINSLLMRHTLHQAPELARKLQELGAAEIHFSEINAADMDPEVKMLDGSLAIKQVLHDMPAKEKREKYAELAALSTPECIVRVPEVLDDEETFDPASGPDWMLTCNDMWEKPFVTADGYVTPCCYAWNSGTLPMGNIREQSFDEIWLGPAYQRLRWQHIVGAHPEYCRGCPQLRLRVNHQTLHHPQTMEQHTAHKVFVGDQGGSFGIAAALRGQKPTPASQA